MTSHRDRGTAGETEPGLAGCGAVRRVGRAGVGVGKAAIARSTPKASVAAPADSGMMRARFMEAWAALCVLQRKPCGAEGRGATFKSKGER